VIYKVKTTDKDGKVIEEIIELTDEQVAQLVAAGAVETQSTIEAVKRHQRRN
jgi:hypothetical protein